MFQLKICNIPGKEVVGGLIGCRPDCSPHAPKNSEVRAFCENQCVDQFGHKSFCYCENVCELYQPDDESETEAADGDEDSGADLIQELRYNQCLEYAMPQDSKFCQKYYSDGEDAAEADATEEEVVELEEEEEEVEEEGGDVADEGDADAADEGEGEAYQEITIYYDNSTSGGQAAYVSYSTESETASSGGTPSRTTSRSLWAPLFIGAAVLSMLALVATQVKIRRKRVSTVEGDFLSKTQPLPLFNSS
jgi:hypothetical protein